MPLVAGAVEALVGYCQALVSGAGDMRSERQLADAKAAELGGTLPAHGP